MPQAKAIARHQSRRILPQDRLQAAIHAAETVAGNCERTQQWVSELEFRSWVVRASRTGKRAQSGVVSANARNQYLDLYVQLEKGDQARLDLAMRRASGNYVVPTDLLRRCGELLRRITGGDPRITAEEFYRGVLGHRVEDVKRALGSAYQEALSGLTPAQAAEVEATRTAVVGLNPGVRGKARGDIFVRLVRAEDLATHTQGEMPLVAFRRYVLESAPDVPDNSVSIAFWRLREAMSEGEKMRLDEAQETATGHVQVERHDRKDLGEFLDRAQHLAEGAQKSGQPIPREDFNKAVLGYDSDNAQTLAAMVSRYRRRMTEGQRAEFDRARKVAIGERGDQSSVQASPQHVPSGGQVFAPDADQMESDAALVRKLGTETFVPTELPVSRPAPLQPMDPRALQLPGLVADVLDIVKPLGFPVGAIDWRKFAVPPSECRPYITGVGVPDGDEGNVPEELPSPVGLPEDLPPPASLSPTSIPRVTLTPTTVGILLVAGLLVLADGPLPFGDAAAVSLLGGRLLTH